VTYQSDVTPLQRVLLRHARDAFLDPASVAAQWRGLGYLGPPDVDNACRESDRLGALLESMGVDVVWAPPTDTGLDSIYVRDAAVLCDGGNIRCRMGKEARAREPAALAATLSDLGVSQRGEVEAPGTLEGGDVTWLAPDWLAVGSGYRTNPRGIDRLRELVGDGVDVTVVPLPHWNGPGDVFHLMSVVSPLAEDLVLVYSPLLPVRFRELLLERGMGLVEVPGPEFGSMACNVLAVAPRVAVALEGNPETRRRMEAAGVDVRLYRGMEISVKGCGGPTCLTRPLERA
jgi:N-dimethylarginine dimethylaminohydrolase